MRGAARQGFEQHRHTRGLSGGAAGRDLGQLPHGPETVLRSPRALLARVDCIAAVGGAHLTRLCTFGGETLGDGMIVVCLPLLIL